MTTTQQTLPHFDNPPVVETLLGVKFAPLEKWCVPHFGLFWQEIRAKYPRFEVQPSIGSPDVLEFGFPDNIPIRCWFYHESNTKLIQVQNDRFLYNWQKYGGDVSYPHYENIRPEFAGEWTRFCKFLESNEIDAPNVELCEVTYTNHLEKGKEWDTIADLPNIFNYWSGNSSNSFLSTPDAVAINTIYSMPDEQGQLSVKLLPVIRSEDGKEILQLQLTAVGQPASSELEDILNWLDFGREWVVRSFVDLTSAKMHSFWKKKESK